MKLSQHQHAEVKKFNAQINEGYYDIEEVDCLCGSNTAKLIYTTDRYGLWSSTVICVHCGLIYSSPRLSASSYKRFYSSDTYRKIYDSGDYIGTFRAKLNDWENNHIYKYLLPLAKTESYHSVIEIGCAAGNNLHAFKKNDFRIKGYEYSKDLVKLGNEEYGLDLENGTTRDAVLSGEKYDIVILNHVLEHFTDIKAELAMIKKLVSSNGVIYIGVPNMDNCSEGQIQNAHTYYFTPRTFGHYMNSYGFSCSPLEPAQIIHMHSVLRVREQKPISLTGEFSRMNKKIRTMQLKEYIGKCLEKMKLRSIAGQIYRRVISLAQQRHAPDA